MLSAVVCVSRGFSQVFLFLFFFFPSWSCESRQRALHRHLPLDTETVFTRGENCRFCLKLLVRSGQCWLLIFASSTRLARKRSLFKSNPLESRRFFAFSHAATQSRRQPPLVLLRQQLSYFLLLLFYLFVCVGGRGFTGGPVFFFLLLLLH